MSQEVSIFPVTWGLNHLLGMSGCFEKSVEISPIENKAFEGLRLLSVKDPHQ